jgi:hypothetical protein
VRHVEHDRVLAPALDKGVELVLDVLGLLPRKARNRIESTIALAGETVAGFAILDLGLKLLLRNFVPWRSLQYSTLDPPPPRGAVDLFPAIALSTATKAIASI